MHCSAPALVGTGGEKDPHCVPGRREKKGKGPSQKRRERICGVVGEEKRENPFFPISRSKCLWEKETMTKAGGRGMGDSGPPPPLPFRSIFYFFPCWACAHPDTDGRRVSPCLNHSPRNCCFVRRRELKLTTYTNEEGQRSARGKRRPSGPLPVSFFFTPRLSGCAGREGGAATTKPEFAFVGL